MKAGKHVIITNTPILCYVLDTLSNCDGDELKEERIRLRVTHGNTIPACSSFGKYHVIHMNYLTMIL